MGNVIVIVLQTIDAIDAIDAVSVTGPLTVIIVAIVAAFPPTLMALAAWRKSAETAKATNAIHLEINSRMTELVELTKKASLAEGIEQERVRGLLDTLDPPRRMEVEVHLPEGNDKDPKEPS